MFVTSDPKYGYVNTGVQCGACDCNLYVHPSDAERVADDINLVVGELCDECELARQDALDAEYEKQEQLIQLAWEKAEQEHVDRAAEYAECCPGWCGTCMYAPACEGD